jgi:DNA-binding IclR family transcriptional regulator
MDPGVRCVAAPIRDYTRRIVGALSLSGPSMRFSDERMEKELIPMIKQATDELSTRLGFHK